jgi:alpha-tubulin suppressor-like RCC1 family protein
MAKNVWTLDVDIKFKYSSSIPTFRRRDTATINFKIHDDKELYDISSFVSGEVTITFPQGRYITRPCQKITIDGIDYVQYNFDRDELDEIGMYQFNLSLKDSMGRVSIPEFSVMLFDSLGASELGYMKIIQDLQNQVKYLEMMEDDIILRSTVGQPNGVVPLDANKKIDNKFLPSFISEHVETDVYLNWVHDFYIDENGVPKYKTKSGQEENVGHPDLSGALKLSVTVRESIAYLTFTGESTVVVKQYMYGNRTMKDVRENGTLFQENNFPVDKTGKWSIYYKDDEGKEYIYKFDVNASDLKVPNVSVSIEKGVITVTDDSDYTVEIQKWDSGSHDIPYFHDNGIVFTDTITVDTSGTYTVYRKYTNGVEVVKVFEVREEDLPTPATVVMTLIPDNSVWTNVDKKANIKITDGAEDVIDKRYYFSTSDNITISNFRTDNNFGTPLTGNEQDVTVTENGFLYAYVKNNYNLDALRKINVASIDKVAPTATSTQEMKNGIVTITITASDNLSGVKRIEAPDGTETNSSTMKFTTFDNGSYKFTIYDNAGNTAIHTVVVTSIDKTPPVITATPATTVWTNQDVRVNVSATSQNGIAQIKWAAGNQTVDYFKTNGTTITSGYFNASANGTYTVYAKDNIDIASVRTISISNIDKVPPVINITQSAPALKITLTATVTDNASGVNRIIKPDGTSTTSSTTTYEVTANGEYTFEAYDNAGNKATQKVTVKDIVLNQYRKFYIRGNKTFMITRAGNVYANGDSQAYLKGDGSNHQNADDNSPTKALVQEVVKVVNDNTVNGGATWFLTGGGQLYVCGRPNRILTGLSADTVSEPTLCPLIDGVVDITVDSSNVFVKKANGDWYGWGLNYHRLLGFGQEGVAVTTPTKLTFADSLGGIKKIASSGQSCMYLLNNGDVYVIGVNSYYQLGLGKAVGTGKVTSLTKVTALGNVIDVAINDNTTFYIDGNGNSHSCGHSSTNGQGEGVNSEVPSRIYNVFNAKEVHATANGAVILTRNNTASGWGSATAIGLSGTYYYSPVDLTITNIRQLSVDDGATIIVNNNDEVFGAGSNSYNRYAQSSIGSVATTFTKLTNWDSLQ